MIYIKDNVLMLPKGEKHTPYVIICNTIYDVNKIDEECSCFSKGNALFIQLSKIIFSFSF